MSVGHAGRRARAWLGTVVALVVAATILSPGVARADHGAWTAHSYTYSDPSPSTYSGYSRINAQDRYDFGWVSFRVYVASSDNTVVQATARCGRVNEGCGLVRTASRAWNQGGAGKRILFIGCAADMTTNHQLGGVLYPVVTPCPQVGLYVHSHRSGTFT